MNKQKNMILILVVSFYLCACGNSGNPTPVAFMNHTVKNRTGYTEDSAAIVEQLKKSLNKHEDFFYSKEYFDSTQLIIDTILYGPDFNKLAVFVIAKNPTYRQLAPNKDYEWYYNATCYLGLRRGDTLDLRWEGPNFSNAYDKSYLSKTMRHSYFTEFATRDTAANSPYKYNLDDIRFWDGPIWQKWKHVK